MPVLDFPSHILKGLQYTQFTMKALISLLLIAAVSFARNPDENVGIKDANLFEGDMIITDDQRMVAKLGLDVDKSTSRGSIRSGFWPGGVLVYEVDPILQTYSQAMTALQAGMKMWTDNTCIRFKKRTNEYAYATFHIGKGCSSEVGSKNKRQHISLASGCWYPGIVAHEIGHALGFYHEQSRPDRDDYVYIYLNNVAEYARYNFDKYSRSTIDSLGTPYDYSSIMHYDSTAFSTNGYATIQPKQQGITIGQRDYLSKTDIAQMNLLYKCSATGGGGSSGGSCRDTHKNCAYWAGIGECHKNADYMLKECKKSCGKCGDICTDIAKNCQYWASTGECQKNPDYMLKDCRKSCKQC